MSFLISVIMTSYNREKFVADAIESVLASTYTNFEFIICDDCSVDGTFEIEKKYAAQDSRIKLFRNDKNLGDFPNRDKAAGHASGKYLKYVDSDDFIYPHGLQTMVDAMLLFPDAVLGLSQIANDLNKLDECPVLISPERAFQEHYFGYGTLRYGPTGAIFTKDILFKMGGFGTNRFIGDTELWLKIAAIYPIVKIQQGLVKWVRHNGQEYYLGNKYHHYIRITYPLDIKSLHSASCPLKKEDVSKILLRLQWKHARDILMVAFKKRAIKTAYSIFKESNLSILQLLKGFIPFGQVK